jgi:undecaprenyl-diphosphatase
MSAHERDRGAGGNATQHPVPVAVPGSGATDTLRRWSAGWHRIEMRCVGFQRRLGACWPFGALSAVANWLGNGWLYLLLASVLLFVGSRRAYLVLLHAGMAVGTAHAVYPWIKRRVGRLRPFERVPQWHPSTPVLDRYSFPSGHCMTATAVAMPLALAYPPWLWAIVAAALVIAWARMACAHHYPTDLVAGCALGTASAYCSGEFLGWLQTL